MALDQHQRDERRQTALSVFGVVQYRKRAPGVSEEHADSAMEAVSEASAAAAIDISGSSQQTAPSLKAPIANSIEDLKAVANELGKEDQKTAEVEAIDQEVNAGEPGIQKSDVGSSSDDLGEATRQFELSFWRCGNLLAVETARSEKESLQFEPESKHRLVNNIYRAIFGSNISGATMYTHASPKDEGSNKVSDVTALEWLNLFLKGQKAKDPNTRLWLMGQDAIELLLAEHGAQDELEGMRLMDTKLDLEIYVTPSLDAMIAKPYLKAGVWKLLRAIKP